MSGNSEQSIRDKFSIPELFFESLPPELQEARLKRRLATAQSLLPDPMQTRYIPLYTSGDLYKVVCAVLVRAKNRSLVSMDAATIQLFIDEALRQIGREK